MRTLERFRTVLLTTCIGFAPLVASALACACACGKDEHLRNDAIVNTTTAESSSEPETDELDGSLTNGSHEETRSPESDTAESDSGGTAPETVIVKGVELVLVPGGTFWMGTPADDPQGDDDERPRHEVTLAPFYLAKTEVTNAQYKLYLDANPDAPKPEYLDDSEYNQPQQPVVGVSWDEAQAYCDWAGLVLPTEAQWEYAARAGTTTRYWSGDEESDLARVGWYGGNSGKRLHEVGEKEANPFGLYDMHGNVWEWCRDGWVDNYKTEARLGDGLRREPVADGDRVLRGGGWGDTARYARSAYRDRNHPGARYGDLGFRPAQVIP